MAKCGNMSDFILNKEELSLLSDTHLFLIKKKLGDKIVALLGECFQSMENVMGEKSYPLEPEILAQQAKISKGENYLGFPWHLLDYPRVFEKDGVFAVRTLCWWGNGFSVSFHLSGKYALQYKDALDYKLPLFIKNDFSICINQNQWHHHFEGDNFIDAKNFKDGSHPFSRHYERYGFIKIMKKIPLSHWDMLPVKCAEILTMYLDGISAPFKSD